MLDLSNTRLSGTRSPKWQGPPGCRRPRPSGPCGRSSDVGTSAGTVRTGPIGWGSGCCALPPAIDDMTKQALPWLEELRDEFDETVNLGILEGHQIRYLAVLASSKAMRLAARVGDRDLSMPLLRGRRSVPPSRGPGASDTRAAGMPERTEETITYVDRYFTELGRVRRLGHAVDNSENEIDGRSVAVQVAGTPLCAAVSLSAPQHGWPCRGFGPVAQRLGTTAEKSAGELGHH